MAGKKGMHKVVPMIERFEKKFKKNEITGCWNWQATLVGRDNIHTYGQFGIASGKMKLAHRVSYELYVGPIPDGIKVCHKCDNPRCVNPGHLFLGTQKENMQDCIRKGRGGKHRGTSHHFCKLNEDQVKEIRNSSESSRKLASKFGVARTNIQRIKKGLIWKSLL